LKVKRHGVFGANIYTITDQSTNGGEYAAFHDSNLANEIRALLEAHGYIVKDLFLDFQEETPCTDLDLVNFKNWKREGERQAQHVYSKANVQRFEIE
jgi:hypothetical protein